MGSKKELADVLESVGLFSRCTSRERRTIARRPDMRVRRAPLRIGGNAVVQQQPGAGGQIGVGGYPDPDNRKIHRDFGAI